MGRPSRKPIPNLSGFFPPYGDIKELGGLALLASVLFAFNFGGVRTPFAALVV